MIFRFVATHLSILAVCCLPTSGKANSETLQAQGILNALGFNPGVVDGAYGSATASALEEFYESIGGVYDHKLDEAEIGDLRYALDRHNELKSGNWMHVESGFSKVNTAIAPALIPYHSATLARTYADIDGDGVPELFGVRHLWSWHGHGNTESLKREMLERGSSASFFKWNSVSGTWKKEPGIRVNNREAGCIHPRSAIAGDFDNDNHVDFFVACHGVDLPPYPRETNNVYIQQDDGSFTIKEPWAEIGFYHSAASADFNRNGFLDVVVTNNMAGKGKNGKAVLRVYLNDGTGKFEYDDSYAPAELRKWRGIFKVSTQDFNEDGLFDLFVGGHELEKAATTIYLNPGNNNFRNAKKIRIRGVRGWGIVLDAIYHDKKVFVLRTGDGGRNKSWDSGFYQGALVQEFDLRSSQSKVVSKIEKDQISDWVPWIYKHRDESGITHIGADEKRLNVIGFPVE